MADLIQIVSWSNRRHWADPHVADRTGGRKRKSICGPYTWGWTEGEHPRSFTPEKVAAMPFCKHCTRKGGDPS